MKQANPVKDQPKRVVWSKTISSAGRIFLIVGVFFFLSQTACSSTPGNETVDKSILPTVSALETPTPAPTSIATPIPTQEGYNWEGTMLYLDIPHPHGPAEAKVYQLKPEGPATIERARFLAQQVGLKGDIYEIPPEESHNGKTVFLVIDGNRQLRVNSELNFWYYPDYNRFRHPENDPAAGQVLSQPDAKRLVGDFLHSYGFDSLSDFKARYLFNGVEAIQLTQDGFEIRKALFDVAGFSFSFDAEGLLIASANLVEYDPFGSFGIISPETALQRIVDHNTVYGVHVYTKSVNPPARTWQRSYPKNQTIILWGPVASFNSVESKTSLITFDGYQVTGNIERLADTPPSTFIEATGQIQEVNGVETFDLETWQLLNTADWEAGDIYRDGEQAIFTNSKYARLTLPDVPTDLPLPFKNAFVRGFIHGTVFEWKYIDNHLQSDVGGGGGGFASLFHKLNLTGMPVPWAVHEASPDTTGQPNGPDKTEGQTDYSGQTAAIEEIELAYYFSNPFFVIHDDTTEPLYLQPIWRFYGHFSGGDEFEILVQALKDEFLLPELEASEP